MEGWQQLDVIRERFRLIVATTLGAALVAFVFANALPKQYEAAATLLVGQVIGAEDPDINDVLLAERLSRTYAVLATTRPVIEDVIDGLGLDVAPDILLGQVSARAEFDSPYVSITVRGPDAEMAAAIANAFAAQIERLSPTATVGEPRTEPVPLIRIVEPAIAPTDPASPRVLLFALLGLVTGAALGVAVAFVLEVLDPRSRTPRAVAQATGWPIVAVVPTRQEREPADGVPVILSADEGPEYQVLRANLAEVRGSDRPKIVVVTAPTRSSGTTTIAVKLALACADSGDRAILVDGRTGGPNLGAMFGLGEGIGLAGLYGSRSTALRNVLRPTQDPRLRIVSGGLAPAGPSAQLDPRQVRAALDKIAAEGDIVVVDGPAVLDGIEGPALAAVADTVVLAVDVSRARRDEVEAARETLERVGANVLGVAINRLSTSPWSHWREGALVPALDRIAAAVRPASGRAGGSPGQ